ncbi:MAG: EamA family transporter, partial [Comamonas sp.]
MHPNASLRHWRDVLLTALAPAIWGSTYIVASEILPPDRPFTAALIRALPAGLLLLLYTRVLPARRDWVRLLVLSALNIGVFQA